MHPAQWTISSRNPHPNRPPQKGYLLRLRKYPDRVCMRNTLCILEFFTSLHLTIFERPANFVFFNSQSTRKSPAHA